MRTWTRSGFLARSWLTVRVRPNNPCSRELLWKKYCCVPCRLTYLRVLENKRWYALPLVMPDAVFLGELNLAASPGNFEFLKGLNDSFAVSRAGVLDRG